MGDTAVSNSGIYVDVSKLIFQLTNGTVVLKRLPNTWLQKSLSTAHTGSVTNNDVEDKENNSKVYIHQTKSNGDKTIKNICDYRTTRREGGGLLKHLISAYCKNCDNKVVGVSRSSATCDQCNDKFRMFVCGKCNSSYCSWRSLQTHMYKLCNPITAYLCNHCDYECYRSSEIQMHVQSHQLSSNLQEPELELYKAPIRCDMCPFTTSFKWSLLLHLRAKHPETVAEPPVEVEEKQKECPKCGRIFTNRNGLREHSEFCQVLPTMQCQFCPHRTYRPSMMRNHLKKVHEIFVKVDNDKQDDQRRERKKALKKRKKDIEKELPYTISRIKIDAQTMMKRFCRVCKKPHHKPKRSSICLFCKGTLQYGCAKCGLTFPNYAKTKDHVRVTCFGKTLYHCRKCSCSRSSREFILNHISKSHNADEK